MDSEASSSNDLLAADLAELGRQVPADRLAPLVSITLQFLVDMKGEDFQANLQNYITSAQVNAAVVKKNVRALILFLQRAVREGWSSEVLGTRGEAMGLPAAVLSKCWSACESQMSRSLLSRVSAASQLQDLEWSFGVTTSTDDCDQVGKTYLQMKLKVAGPTGNRDVFVELSLEQFYDFLGQMEKAKAYLDFLKGEASV